MRNAASCCQLRILEFTTCCTVSPLRLPCCVYLNRTRSSWDLFIVNLRSPRLFVSLRFLLCSALSCCTLPPFPSLRWPQVAASRFVDSPAGSPRCQVFCVICCGWLLGFSLRPRIESSRVASELGWGPQRPPLRVFLKLRQKLSPLNVDERFVVKLLAHK